jgi:RNA polymerase sigma factor (TIGR02999 family)
MSDTSTQEVTALLLAWREGNESALETLMSMVYAELHKRARWYLKQERQDHTLQATALVNEVYLRLVDSSKVRWQNRVHFFAVAAQLMRRILVDFARSRNYQKRGGGAHQVSLDQAMVVTADKSEDLVALDDALKSLAAIDERKSKVVELRFFGGLSVEETAEVLQVSPDTVMRDWRLAKVWLLKELSGNTDDES